MLVVLPPDPLIFIDTGCKFLGDGEGFLGDGEEDCLQWPPFRSSPSSEGIESRKARAYGL